MDHDGPSAEIHHLGDDTGSADGFVEAVRLLRHDELDTPTELPVFFCWVFFRVLFAGNRGEIIDEKKGTEARNMLTVVYMLIQMFSNRANHL